MPRFKKPTKEEVRSRRAKLADRARAGDLRLPGAVRDIRASLGLSQESFARMLRLTRRQLSEIERGETNPTAETLERIGSVFGFTLGFVPARHQPSAPTVSAGIGLDRSDE